VSRSLGLTGTEAPLRARDLPWLAAIVLFAGVVGPALLMSGLSLSPASSGALLLNTESLATMAIGRLVFRENVDRRLFLGAMAILAGAVLLSWPKGGVASPQFNWGSVLIILACVAWGIDNNLTRKLSGADPASICTLRRRTSICMSPQNTSTVISTTRITSMRICRAISERATQPFAPSRLGCAQAPARSRSPSPPRTSRCLSGSTRPAAEAEQASIDAGAARVLGASVLPNLSDDLATP
jgi:hypothetical protein